MGAASGAGLYATSSAELKSFGGGGNGGAAMGGSTRGNSVSTPSPQGGTGVGFISSPIAYSTARRGEMSSTSGTNPAMMVAENPAVAAMGAANAANGIYGAYSVMDYSGSVNYGQYTGMFGGGRSNVRGRQNALGFNDSWWKWFDTWVRNNGDSYYDDETKGYYFDRYSLESVYTAFLANFWNSGMGDPPSFDEWLDWYQSAMGENGFYVYGDSNRTYYWVPVGDILPLLLIALLYVLFVAIKSNALKSLIKTERSE
jgi:hypothetical protein